MPHAFVLSIGIVTGLLGAQIFLRPLLVSHFRKVFWLTTSALFGFLIIKSTELYLAWKSGLATQYLLPPHQPITVFLLRAWNIFFVPYVISFLVAFLFLIIVRRLPARVRDLRFEVYEPHILATGLLLVGHPLWILYLVVTLVLFVLYALVTQIVSRKSLRVSFASFWLPAALITLLLTPILVQIPLLTPLIIFQNNPF